MKRAVIILCVLATCLVSLTFGNFPAKASTILAGLDATTTKSSSVYSGPNTGFSTLVRLSTNAAIKAIARSQDNQWVQVDTLQRLYVGWVAASNVQINGDINALPAVPLVSPKDVKPLLDNYCLNHVVIPAAPPPVWADGSNDAAFRINTVVVANQSGGLFPFNSARELRGLRSDLPTWVLCVQDMGPMPIYTCNYGGPDGIHQTQVFAPVYQIVGYSLHDGQARTFNFPLTGPADRSVYRITQSMVDPNYTWTPDQNYANWKMTPAEKQRAIDANLKMQICPEHLKPTVTRLDGGKITISQFVGYIMFGWQISRTPYHG